MKEEYEERIGELRDRPPGSQDSDPYENTDVSELPKWWRSAISKFEDKDLRSFRPPRFTDGVLKFEVIESLEEKYGINIKLVGRNVKLGDKWEVLVDGNTVTRIGRHRHPSGYSVFEIKSHEFQDMLEDYIDETR